MQRTGQPEGGKVVPLQTGLPREVFLHQRQLEGVESPDRVLAVHRQAPHRLPPRGKDLVPGHRAPPHLPPVGPRGARLREPVPRDPALEVEVERTVHDRERVPQERVHPCLLRCLDGPPVVLRVRLQEVRVQRRLVDVQKVRPGLVAPLVQEPLGRLGLRGLVLPAGQSLQEVVEVAQAHLEPCPGP